MKSVSFLWDSMYEWLRILQRIFKKIKKKSPKAIEMVYSDISIPSLLTPSPASFRRKKDRIQWKSPHVDSVENTIFWKNRKEISKKKLLCCFFLCVHIIWTYTYIFVTRVYIPLWDDVFTLEIQICNAEMICEFDTYFIIAFFCK